MTQELRRRAKERKEGEGEWGGGWGVGGVSKQTDAAKCSLLCKKTHVTHLDRRMFLSVCLLLLYKRSRIPAIINSMPGPMLIVQAVAAQTIKCLIFPHVFFFFFVTRAGNAAIKREIWLRKTRGEARQRPEVQQTSKSGV